MAFNDFLYDRADVYHLNRIEKPVGYGLPASPCFDYSATPDAVSVECKFERKTRTVSVIQTEPRALLQARIKLVYPTGVDIRLNDKIVDCSTGEEYTAEQPYDIHGHHMAVFVKKTEQQEVL